MELKQDTIKNQITNKSFEEFSKRVKRIMKEYSIKKIDRIIDSMEKRITMILKAKGNRIKY